MDHLFLDANVLFNAAYREESGLQQLWRLDDVELLTSPYAFEEARFNLSHSEQLTRLDRLTQRLQLVSDVPLDRPLPEDVNLPEKDRPILLAAIEHEATHLVTGDRRHFGRYFGRRISGVLVLTPAPYLRSRSSLSE